jgi:hypothetical protein
MEQVQEKKIKIARTRTGVPCLWESTMKFADLRRATVILDSEGKGKPAVYLNTDREKQALVPIVVGDQISKAFEDKHGIALSVFKITEISSMENTATIVPVYRKSSLISEYEVPSEHAVSVDKAVRKLTETTVISYASTNNIVKESV